MAYEFLKHTADIKVKVKADTTEKLFIESAMALKEIIVGNTKIKEKEKKEILIKGNDLENLLYLFLEEFLFLIDSNNFLPSSIKSLSIERDTLKATVYGDNIKKYKYLNEVKAITYNSMSIKKSANLFETEIVFDV
jgi:SHS2 domain-containing protein